MRIWAEKIDGSNGGPVTARESVAGNILQQDCVVQELLSGGERHSEIDAAKTVFDKRMLEPSEIVMAISSFRRL